MYFLLPFKDDVYNFKNTATILTENCRNILISYSTHYHIFLVLFDRFFNYFFSDTMPLSDYIRKFLSELTLKICCEQTKHNYKIINKIGKNIT